MRLVVAAQERRGHRRDPHRGRCGPRRVPQPPRPLAVLGRQLAASCNAFAPAMGAAGHSAIVGRGCATAVTWSGVRSTRVTCSALGTRTAKEKARAEHRGRESRSLPDPALKYTLAQHGKCGRTKSDRPPSAKRGRVSFAPMSGESGTIATARKRTLAAREV
jgi:hypothetical protein